MRRHNGSDVSEIREAPIYAKVLVYCTKNKVWARQFMFLNIDGETATVQFPDAPKPFRTTVVKVFKLDATVQQVLLRQYH